MISEPHLSDGIAIIGMAGRFTGAGSVDEFWQNLIEGKDSISSFTDAQCRASGASDTMINAPNFVKRGGMIDGIDLFDASFFGYSPKEAAAIDPQQRIFLECSYEALENAGYCPNAYEGIIGVYAGCGMNNYLLKNLLSTDPLMETVVSPMVFFGNDKDFLTTRVSYKLNLTGPSIDIQSACSTSLSAVQLACQGLQTYQCDMAVSGGISLQAPRMKGYLYEEGHILSSDGYCRAFDKSATGTVFGEGVGIVVLKRIEDAIADRDTIYAVIRGIALNNDGSGKAGFTAPSIDGQASVIALAHGIAGVEADEISYVETHGTGTPLGDPIEIAALTQAFSLSTRNKGFCAIGSVKPNIGHLDVAAGVASLIKTALALKYAKIPPSIHFSEPNPDLDLENSPFYINQGLTDWDSGNKPRIAGVSSFGIGGTNAHAVLQEPPMMDSTISLHPSQLLLLSAKSQAALEKVALNLGRRLSRDPAINLADTAFTLMVGREHHKYRGFVVCDSIESAVRDLNNDSGGGSASRLPSRDRQVVFMFSGQGAQYPQMAGELYERLPVFRREVDRCADILLPLLGVDLRDIIYPNEAHADNASSQLNETYLTQPALFTVEYALAKFFLSCGVQPSAMIGHSIGEYVAACLAGVFSLQDGLKLIAERGRLVQEQARGAMLAVQLPEDEIRPMIHGNLSIATVNGPKQCVVSGPIDEIDQLKRTLASLSAQQTINCAKINTSHAFHSKMMEPAAKGLTAVMNECDLKRPVIPYISNVTGNFITDEQSTDAGYWAKHLTRTVRFSDGIKTLLDKFNPMLIEIGPGMVLSGLARQHLGPSDDAAVFSTIRHRDHKISDFAYLLKTLGNMWQEGISIDWNGYYQDEERKRIPLPGYPFERKKFWIDYATTKAAAIQMSPRPQPAEPYAHGLENNIDTDAPIIEKAAAKTDTETSLANIWKNILGYKHIDIDDNFFELGGSSLMAVALFNKIESIHGVRLPLATLYEAPTVRALGKIIKSDDYIPAWNSLVTINKGSANKQPFFCVHAEGGNVLEYRLLSKYLGDDQPFYGVQAKGLQGETVVEDSIEEMAASYIKEIKTVQAHGPYLIGGYCLGGLVAYEIAQQLIKSGDGIALLVLISNATPDQMRKTISGLTRIKQLGYRSLERIELELDNLSALNLKQKRMHIVDRFIRLNTSIRVSYEDLVDKLYAAAGKAYQSHSRAYVLKKSVAHTNLAYAVYDPKPICCPIHLFQVSRPLREREILWGEYWGWKNYADKGIHKYPVKAFHKNVLKNPYVQVLARKIKALIEDATKKKNNGE